MAKVLGNSSNRETDLMLIVLSFAILVSQLPCSIAWYFIYYRHGLEHFTDYTAARAPILLYAIRLLEMVYFSLNFFFFMALSRSLRRELRLRLSRTLEAARLKRCCCLTRRSESQSHQIKSRKENRAANRETMGN